MDNGRNNLYTSIQVHNLRVAAAATAMVDGHAVTAYTFSCAVSTHLSSNKKSRTLRTWVLASHWAFPGREPKEGSAEQHVGDGCV
eukprot:CAMPEP_0174286964 /NCGR_PEP_ID=MMETSP0809-20121228/13897_1 /TAXON_ID=73025 ORGANISM="Eutreptiella gymnastica-like, Strain CCMP1594" /NCGR_SAMPLE_ID=MMETSP0809 /ASSEMBLY_ACC=CAM_ASM_000658 /LENGTH=84 /DNA_ID=CAMNT_0015383269 /DNA_START=191 /DNA_END=442 /DNA_ORIENTATION=+